MVGRAGCQQWVYYYYETDLTILLVNWAVQVLFFVRSPSAWLHLPLTTCDFGCNCVYIVILIDWLPVTNRLELFLVSLYIGCPRKRKFFFGVGKRFFLLSKALAYFCKSQSLLFYGVLARVFSFTTSWPRSFHRSYGQHMRLNTGPFFTAMGDYSKLKIF